MNLKINIQPKRDLLIWTIFFSMINFRKAQKQFLMAVAEEANEIFMSLNGDNCLPHSSFDLSVFLFQEDFKCIENQKQICCL